VQWPQTAMTAAGERATPIPIMAVLEGSPTVVQQSSTPIEIEFVHGAISPNHKPESRGLLPIRGVKGSCRERPTSLNSHDWWKEGSSGPTDGRIFPDLLTKFAVPIQIFPDALIRELRDTCLKIRGILARRTEIKSKFEEIPCKFPC